MKRSSFRMGTLFIVFFTSCTTTTHIVNTNNQIDAVGSAKILMAAYQQKAAEYRALCYQAYNIAQLRLDEFLKRTYPKPPAIMTDIDETILDNSPYQVHQSLQGKDYDAVTWHEWTAKASADTVPGALKFFQYAASKGVEIYYVTNRDEDERIATLKNLQRFGFPNADNEHLKLKSTSSSKVPRRDSIAMTHTLLMQVGDNLNDVNGIFEKKSVSERLKDADSYRSEFGYQYIVLPNPSYGEWENALYNYKFNLTPAQKDSIFRAVLKNW